MARRGVAPKGTGARKSPPPAVPGIIIEVVVDALGSHGDGIADSALGRLYVPRTLPGERVRVRVLGPRGDGHGAEALALLVPSAERVTPPCRHFARCGGCALQHLSPRAYAAFKEQRLTAALSRAGLLPGEIEALKPTPPGGRRRARLAAVGEGAGACRLGFHERRSEAVVDLAECAVLAPAIVAVLPPLRRFLGRQLRAGERAAATITLLDGGLDLVVECRRPPDLAFREEAVAFAAEADVARVSWRGSPAGEAEPMVQRRPLGLWLGGVFVAPPPGAFVQASAEGEAALIAAVRAGLGAARRVVDLFSGVGTFAVPLAAEGRQVLAVDADAAALAAARRALPTLSTECRDLGARPLAAAELRRFEAAVFDPPRAGAAAQAAQLAASGIPVVIAVSCNPETFARDGALLRQGGYGLFRVVPIDQFLWSPHLELVAVFSRETNATWASGC